MTPRLQELRLKELTSKYEKIFLEDLDELNIIRPNITPRATEHIKDMVELIKILLKKEKHSFSFFKK